MRWRIIGLFSFCLLAAAPAFGGQTDLLAGAQWLFFKPAGDATISRQASVHLPANIPPGESVITISTAVTPFWDIELSHDIPADVPEGDRINFRFWARAAGGNHIRAVVERTVSPWTGVIVEYFALTPAWREYSFTGISPGFGPGGIAARIQLGKETGTVEIAGVSVADDGPDPIYASADADLTPDAIHARIAKYRMADLTVQVRDAHGRPLDGAGVDVEQTRHAFLFGCNIFGLRPGDTDPSQLTYQKRFADLFNYATLPFYWSSFEPEQGHPEYARLDAMADWCAAHGIVTKGHPLVWHQTYPAWAPSDPEQAKALFEGRIRDIVSHYRGRVAYWDVINEVTSAETGGNGEANWVTRDGEQAVVEDVLRTARSAAGGSPETFVVNDFDTSEHNVDLFKSLAAASSLPDAIGIQSHMHAGVWSLRKVWVVCQTFAVFHRPLHFTEVTVVSGPATGEIPWGGGPDLTDWVTTPAGEKEQADYVRQFYTLLFSHPEVRAITWWDLSDAGAWVGAPAGLIHKDMSPKPAYDALMSLIHGQWWTSSKGATDRHGAYRVHAFYGDYRITVTSPGARPQTVMASMPEASGPLRVVVTVP